MSDLELPQFRDDFSALVVAFFGNHETDGIANAVHQWLIWADNNRDAVVKEVWRAATEIIVRKHLMLGCPPHVLVWLEAMVTRYLALTPDTELHGAKRRLVQFVCSEDRNSANDTWTALLKKVRTWPLVTTWDVVRNMLRGITTRHSPNEIVAASLVINQDQLRRLDTALVEWSDTAPVILSLIFWVWSHNCGDLLVPVVAHLFLTSPTVVIMHLMKHEVTSRPARLADVCDSLLRSFQQLRLSHLIPFAVPEERQVHLMVDFFDALAYCAQGEDFGMLPQVKQLWSSATGAFASAGLQVAFSVFQQLAEKHMYSAQPRFFLAWMEVDVLYHLLSLLHNYYLLPRDGGDHLPQAIQTSISNYYRQTAHPVTASAATAALRLLVVVWGSAPVEVHDATELDIWLNVLSEDAEQHVIKSATVMDTLMLSACQKSHIALVCCILRNLKHMELLQQRSSGIPAKLVDLLCKSKCTSSTVPPPRLAYLIAYVWPRLLSHICSSVDQWIGDSFSDTYVTNDEASNSVLELAGLAVLQDTMSSASALMEGIIDSHHQSVAVLKCVNTALQQFGIPLTDRSRRQIDADLHAPGPSDEFRATAQQIIKDSGMGLVGEWVDNILKHDERETLAGWSVTPSNRMLTSEDARNHASLDNERHRTEQENLVGRLQNARRIQVLRNGKELVLQKTFDFISQTEQAARKLMTLCASANEEGRIPQLPYYYPTAITTTTIDESTGLREVKICMNLCGQHTCVDIEANEDVSVVTLLDAKDQCRNDIMEVAHIRHVVRSVLTALVAIHTINCVHGDVQLRNIVLSSLQIDEDTVVTLTGWNMSALSEMGRSPEELSTLKDYKVNLGAQDVWQLAQVVLSLLGVCGMHFAQKLAERGASIESIVEEGASVPPSLHQFLCRCLCANPCNRPTTEVLLKDPWVLGIEPNANNAEDGDGFDLCDDFSKS